MCVSNVHQDKTPIEVLGTIQHSLLTAIDDLEVFVMTHRPADPTRHNIETAARALLAPRKTLLTEMSRLSEEQRQGAT